VNLQSLLEHLGSHVLDDRATLASGQPDSLWPDSLLTRYLNDGQNIFCRKAWPIIDDTTAACSRITLVLDQSTYALHSSVMRVLSVTPADTDIPLVWLDYSLISPKPSPSFPDYYQVPPAPFVEQSGRPGWYSTDEATRVLRVRATPDATAVADIVTLNLRVARLPITPLSVSTPGGSPEIPEEYHLDLCDYAAGRALSQANVDSGDVRAEGRGMIQDFYAKLRAAKNDRLIAQMAPGQYLFSGGVRTNRY
jgi:hypothetical protein